MNLLVLVMLSQSFNLNQQHGSSSNNPIYTKSTEYGTSAFGALRVEQTYVTGDLTNPYGLDLNEIYRTKGDGGVVALLNESASLISGGTMQVRTDKRFHYQAGHGTAVIQTVAIPTAADAGTYAWGLFDDNDGLFWRYSAAGLQFIRRTSTDGGVSETAFSVDAGPAWDPRLVSIYEFRLQWLGSGKTKTYINGQEALVVDNANKFTGAYMKTADLPMSWDVTGTNASMKAVCASVAVEGGQLPSTLTYAASRTADLTITASSGLVPVISIRPSAFYKTIRNRSVNHPNAIWCTSDTKRIGVSFILNPTTLTGAAFSAVNSRGFTEFDVAATAVVGGTVVGNMSVTANGFQEQKLSYIFSETTRYLNQIAFASGSADAGHTSELDTLTIAADNPGAGNATVRCGIEYAEEY